MVLGASLSPFDSWLLLRGLKTLALRVRQINENAMQLASWLQDSAWIKRVIYVGLPTHKQHQLAKIQLHGFTGMMCIELAGKDEDQAFRRAQKILNTLHIFVNAASLGGVESLIVHPASMWGSHHSADQKKIAGISQGMLRLSIGIEHIDDLIADFEQAFAQLDANE